MLYKQMRLFRIFGIMAGVLFLLSCSSGKKAPIEHYETDMITTEESVSRGPIIEEETFEIPGTIEEQELAALRSLKAAAEQEGALEDIRFDFNHYNLRPETQQQLQRTARWLEDNPSVKVFIEGHCDERGSQEYNLALGERRAVAVHSYLRSLGVEAVRMGTISYGEEQPVDPSSNEAAWAKNRRVHFDITSR